MQKKRIKRASINGKKKARIKPGEKYGNDK
jgi:hypothetical protein